MVCITDNDLVLETHENWHQTLYYKLNLGITAKLQAVHLKLLLNKETIIGVNCYVGIGALVLT